MQGSRSRRIALLFIAFGAMIGMAIVLLASARKDNGDSQGGLSQVYSPAHRTLMGALREFFDIEPSATSQPVAFSHKKHLANGMRCVDCHTGVDEGPDARIPSVKFCMTCHQAIDTDNPEIKKIAAYYAKGEDIPWNRVDGYYPDSHVKFWHAPHRRAGVGCEACHGDMTKQTVAVRSINLNMGFCIDCHRMKKASLDCTTCHF